MKEKILKLKQEHPDWGYKRIANTLGCSPNAVKYHVNPNEKANSLRRTAKTRKTIKYILKRKKDQFICDHYKDRTKSEFLAQNLYQKLTSNPVCYLTGDRIDLNNSRSFELDHIIPRARGGSNALENCGLSTKAANRAKADMTLDGFLILCQKVLTHNGFIVTKIKD